MDKNNRSWIAMLVLVAVVFTALGGAGGWLLFWYTERMQEDSPYAVLMEAADLVENNFVGEQDAEAVVEASIDGMVSALGDRWTHYLNPEEAQQHAQDQQNVMVGIGTTVTLEEGGGMRIMEIVPGGGAEEAGLVVGDVILAADGTSILEMSLAEAKPLVAGKEGTKVLLTIRHADGSQEDIYVERRVVFLSPITGSMIGDVGYIIIEDFDDGCADAFLEMLDALIGQGATAFIFDVRYNGGGYVREMTAILDRLLPEGEIFVSVDSEGNETVTKSDSTFLDMPMAVLVNASSFSAAEYFAAILQEYGAAVIVGEHTVGKGYSQQTFTLSDGSALVLSTKSYRLPSGISLAEVGITPDIELTLDEEAAAYLYYGQLPIEEDAQLQAALQCVASE